MVPWDRTSISQPLRMWKKGHPDVVDVVIELVAERVSETVSKPHIVVLADAVVLANNVF